MNTIHSSSLASYRIGYIKPEPDRFEKNPANPARANARSSNNQQLTGPVSTPEQVKAALDKSELNKVNSYEQSGSSRTAKALIAYAEARNQPIQTELAADLFHLDIYV